MHSCPMCDRVYIMSDEDYTITAGGKHIRLHCTCDPDYGLDILIGAEPTEYDGKPAYNMYSFETRQFGEKILQDEIPAIRETVNMTVKEAHAIQIAEALGLAPTLPQTQDCF